MAKNNALLLLDEPFGQIDNFKKNTLRRSLFRYLKDKNIACIVATHDKNDALSFADQLMVIKNHNIIVKDNPIIIYSNPSEKYIAALFDDVNELNLGDEKKLLYPHNLEIVTSSKYKAVVLKNYFKGSFWLVECKYNNQTIFINSASFLHEGETIFFDIKKPS